MILPLDCWFFQYAFSAFRKDLCSAHHFLTKTCLDEMTKIIALIFRPASDSDRLENWKTCRHLKDIVTYCQWCTIPAMSWFRFRFQAYYESLILIPIPGLLWKPDSEFSICLILIPVKSRIIPELIPIPQSESESLLPVSVVKVIETVSIFPPFHASICPSVILSTLSRPTLLTYRHQN